ncbi:MAG: hypothetical protein ACI8T1_004806 [Verrucomicrobiales bacterium]|jgi:hypothetical protein
MDGFWFVFVRLCVTAEPETIQPISNNSWGTATAEEEEKHDDDSFGL